MLNINIAAYTYYDLQQKIVINATESGVSICNVDIEGIYFDQVALLTNKLTALSDEISKFIPNGKVNKYADLPDFGFYQETFFFQADVKKVINLLDNAFIQCVGCSFSALMSITSRPKMHGAVVN